jgi:hypothetical protein
MWPFQKRLTRMEVLKVNLDFYWEETAYVTNQIRLEKMRQFLLQSQQYYEQEQLHLAFDSLYLARRELNLARMHRQIYYRREWKGMYAALCLLIIFIFIILLLWFFQSYLIVSAIMPLLAAIGGGVGGCTAVLIQAININPESETVSKFLWYIIKPFLGLALGAITYFVILAGFNVLSGGAVIDNFAGAVVIGFLAGFFESFSKGVLARVAGQFSENEKQTDENQQKNEKNQGEEEK